MFRKSLVVGLFTAIIFFVASPASAYVELVVAPAGYTFDPLGDAPEITVTPSEQFILELCIWTDENSVTTVGLNAYIYFDPSLAKVKDENGNIVDYPDWVVDDSECEIYWASTLGWSQGNNITGKVSYEQQTSFAEPQPVPYGKTHIGWLEFRCEGAGGVLIYPGDDSSLLSIMPGNLLTGCQGTLVHQVPEPATLVLLGGGLFLHGLIYRKRKE